MIKSSVYFFSHCAMLFAGYFYFKLTGKNTERGYQAMVYLFCHTGGRVNAWLARLETLFGAKLKGVEGSGVLGQVSEMRTSDIQLLHRRGYLVKEAALPIEMVERLMKFALSTPAIVRAMDGQIMGGAERVEIINLDHSAAVRYDYRANDLLANSDIQNLIADPSLLALAESYLGAAPKLDVLGMWWHTKFHDQPDSMAAQMYHFDLDRPRWLKIFIYLTDVGQENGPHSFIEGTHHIDSIPGKFMHRGYARISDEEIHNEFGATREVVFVAPRGSIIAEDTIGLHKGAVVKDGARLLLQLQFSSSLFGASYPKARLPAERTSALQKMIALNPTVYSAYL